MTLPRNVRMVWCEPGVGGAFRCKVTNILTEELCSYINCNVRQPLGAGGVTMTTHVTLPRSTRTGVVTADRGGGVGEERAVVGQVPRPSIVVGECHAARVIIAVSLTC